MSHDTEAAYASSEVADWIMQNQNDYFGNLGTRGSWSVYAGREGSHQWPLADGVILAQNATHSDVKIAFEYKRPNEGVHGILTALGQSFAYLEKGYNASVMVIPDKYSSHSTPGDHVKRVLEATSPEVPISIYTYREPDLSSIRPFQGKLNCVRNICLPNCRTIARQDVAASTGEVSTLWAHMREGMSHLDVFYRYCQGVKIITATNENIVSVDFPEALIDAVQRLDPRADIYKYLSYTSGDSISDKAWRFVWYNFLFWKDLIPIWSQTNPYQVNNTSTKIRINDDEMQNLLSGRSDSPKETLIAQLNRGEITEEDAWVYSLKCK